MIDVQPDQREALLDTQANSHEEDNRLMHHMDMTNNNSSDDSDSTTRPDPPKRVHSLEEFTEDLGEDEYDSLAGHIITVDFDGHRVVLENKNIFKSTKLKIQLLASMLSLFMIGLADQAIGSLIEYIMAEYNIDRVKISYLFFAQFCGYIPASMLNNYFMDRYGLHFLYYSTCICSIISSLAFVFRAPFFVLPIASICFGWANGTLDCILNYFVGTLDYSNELLGLMHSMYGCGCLITPVLSIWMVNHGMTWNIYYLILMAVAFLNLILAYAFFKNETAAKYRYLMSQNNKESYPDNESGSNSVNPSSALSDEYTITEKPNPSTLETLTNKYVIFYSLALFTYVGSELSVGVWLNNYLFRIQNQTEQKASYVTSAYWLFMTLGRGSMGFFTGRYYKDREIRAIVVYCWMVALGCLFFWIFQHSIILQEIFICLAGFFVGPLFGTTIIIAIKTLPSRFSLRGISLIAGFGGTGGAVIPAIMGYIAENFGSDGKGTNSGAGLVYFPQVVCISFTTAAFLWLFFYLSNKKAFDSKIRLN